jgi:hypothetical protein
MILMPLSALITGSVAVLLIYTQGTHLVPLVMFTLAIVLGSLFWIVPAVVQKIYKKPQDHFLLVEYLAAFAQYGRGGENE